MKKNLKIMSAVGLASVGLISVAVLSGCTTTEDPDTTTSGGGSTSSLSLTVSGPASQASWLSSVLADYNTQREAEGLETIDFELVTHGEDAVDTEITDWTSGPDVYAYASDKIMGLYQAGALAVVPDEYVEMISDTMNEAALDAVTFAGQVVSYPYAGDNGYFLYYNKELIDLEDCATIEGLLDKAAELGMNVAYPLETAFYSAGALFTYGASYSLTVDAAGIVTNIDADFDSDAGIMAGLAILQIVTHDAYQETQAAPTAANGVVACVDGSWNASTYEAAMGEGYAATKLPTVTVSYNGDTQTTTLGSFLGYKNYGVNPQRSSGDAERLALAHEVAAYLCSEEVQESRFDNFQTAPTNTNVAALEKVQTNVSVMAINEQAVYATPQTAVPANIWSAPQELVANIKDGSVTEENIAEAMVTLNNSIKASQ